MKWKVWMVFSGRVAAIKIVSFYCVCFKRIVIPITCTERCPCECAEGIPNFIFHIAKRVHHIQCFQNIKPQFENKKMWIESLSCYWRMEYAIFFLYTHPAALCRIPLQHTWDMPVTDIRNVLGKLETTKRHTIVSRRMASVCAHVWDLYTHIYICAWFIKTCIDTQKKNIESSWTAVYIVHSVGKRHVIQYDRYLAPPERALTKSLSSFLLRLIILKVISQHHLRLFANVTSKSNLSLWIVSPYVDFFFFVWFVFVFCFCWCCWCCCMLHLGSATTVSNIIIFDLFAELADGRKTVGSAGSRRSRQNCNYLFFFYLTIWQ